MFGELVLLSIIFETIGTMVIEVLHILPFFPEIRVVSLTCVLCTPGTTTDILNAYERAEIYYCSLYFYEYQIRLTPL